MPAPKRKSIPKTISAPLLKWYDTYRRVMPWRAPPGVQPNPYYVWLSEIMLQQTTVATVGPYFKKFVTTWPTLEKLAKAKEDAVLAAWAGLGYYSRARNLHKCANVLLRDHAARLPADHDTLLTLPGIGRYTAAAISAIAFDKPANVVDGNVERVMARLFAVKTPMPKAKAELTALAATLVPQKRPGDYAQALMDLGATVCTPKSPKCDMCPLQRLCKAKALGKQESFPVRAAKKAVPDHKTTVYVITQGAGNDMRVLLRRRGSTGLLAGMAEMPNEGLQQQDTRRLPVKAGRLTALPETVTHTFSHFRLTMMVKRGTAGKGAALPAPYFWAKVGTLDAEALPTVMRKVLLATGLVSGRRKH